MTSKIGQNTAFQVSILQIESSPFPWQAAIHYVVPQRIGVVTEPAVGESVKGWVQIGQSFLGRGDNRRVFPESNALFWRIDVFPHGPKILALLPQDRLRRALVQYFAIMGEKEVKRAM